MIKGNTISGDKIQGNTITGDKIVANAITSNLIRAGSVTADKIASNSVSTQHLQANSITGDKILANSINASKLMADSVGTRELQANSVGANIIQANAVTADKIASNSITSAKISAGAIRADHLASGSVSTEKLAVGLGGNLLPNPIFANSANQWDWANGSQTGLKFERHFLLNNPHSTGDWTLYNGLTTENIIKGTFTGNQTTLKQGQWADVAFITLKVNAGKKYILSAYYRSYRCAGNILIEKYSADMKSYQGIVAQSKLIGDINNADAQGTFQKGLTHAPRHFVAFTAPDTGVISIRFRISQWHGNNPMYIWLAHN